MTHTTIDTSAMPRDRADDEKTIHAEQEYSDKKTVDGTKSSSASGTESVRLKECREDAPTFEDDFPDGGFRAWLVVFGVRNNIYPGHYLVNIVTRLR